ncbi:hypothetical protein B0H13DRAFT_2362366 [Mycena leptocephala]|nr:hypothetical protein B0H13DRAFT_2362366 [Mycena leptocephala]
MFSKTFNFVFLATRMATVIASPAAEVNVNGLVAKDNCNDHLGRCDQNGCAGVYPDPNSTHGACTAGQFNGCPCNKCGDTNGSCNDNVLFQGCPCNE